MGLVAITSALLLCAAPAETGVTDSEVVLGQPAAFSGPSAGLGVEMWRGASAAFAEANERGGVHGRKLRLTLADDAYDADKAALAVLNLATKEKVFALFGGVGTPTIVKALPVVLKFHQKDGLFYFANFTGAQPQREPPYDKAVFNVRASYLQETRAIVDVFVKMGLKKIGVYVQDDAYGASGRDGVRKALAEHGLAIAADTSYPRGQKFEASTAEQLAMLRKAGVDAVVSVGAYQACAALIREARSAGWNVPIHNLSFVGADQMLTLLRAEEKRSGKMLTNNLITTQVVPGYDEVTLRGVQEYRAAMDKFNPTLPAGIGDRSYQPPARYSFGSLEGYLSARAFLSVLEKAGQELTRKRFIQAAEAMGAFDLGLGAPAELSASRHQALDKVWFSVVTPSGWRMTANPASVLKIQ
jgi:ABC-type branched-subunit amino acid transport system substrate-binding protein